MSLCVGIEMISENWSVFLGKWKSQMRLNKAKSKHEGIHFVAGVVMHFLGLFPLAFHSFQAIGGGPCERPRTGMSEAMER